MKFHDNLCEKIFNGEELKPEVSEKLLEISDAFIEFLDIPAEAIKDVVITGSMVSYNYTQYSDIDLHLKVDYDKIHEDCPIVQGYLWQSKAMFNKNHDIKIYGIPVEVYAESVEEDTVHNGLYSLWQGKWIDFPEKIEPTDNDGAVEAKFNEFKDMADNINDSEEAEELIDKLYIMRKAGLEEVGEFSTENLAFKKVRDAGILERLKQMKKEKIDKELSLESYNELINEEVTVDSYLKMLRDGGYLFDKEDAEYLIQCFNNKKLEVLAEYKDVEKAAQRFLDCCNKYDKVVFKQLFDNGKEIKVIDTDTKELNKKPLFMEQKMSKIKESIKEQIDKELSLESYNESSNDIEFDGDKILKLREQGKIKSIRFADVKIGDRLLTYNGVYCTGILKVEKKNTMYDNEGRFMVEVEGKREEPVGHACGSNATLYGDGSFLIVSDDVTQLDIIKDKKKSEDYATLYDKVDSASSDLKELVDELPQFFEEGYKENIYKLSTIGKALELEKEYLEDVETVDGRAENLVTFIIPDGENIERTNFVKRNGVENYKPQENEYILDMVRDTGWWTTDYNLIPMKDYIDRLNSMSETVEGEKDMEEQHEDMATLTNKVDNVESDLEELLRSLTQAVNEALDEKSLKIEWSFKNPDQYSEMDRIYEELIITRHADGTYSWEETENLEHAEGFATAEEAYADAEKVLEDYDDFQIDIDFSSLKEYFEKA